MRSSTDVLPGASQLGVRDWWILSNGFEDSTLFDIDPVHLSLTTGDEEFICTRFREAHAAEIYHVTLCYVPLRQSFAIREMYTPR